MPPTEISLGLGSRESEPVGAGGSDGDGDGLATAGVGEAEGEGDGWPAAELHATSTSVARIEAARAIRDMLDSPCLAAVGRPTACDNEDAVSTALQQAARRQSVSSNVHAGNLDRPASAECSTSAREGRRATSPPESPARVHGRRCIAPTSLAAMKLVVTDFVTVDGIVEAPGFDEHRSGRNAWALRVQNDEDQAYNMAQAMSAEAFLLGRRTWQIWAAFWPTAEGAEPQLTNRMNSIPKYVVSNTLKRADWHNTTIISGDVAAQVRKLKAEPGGDLLVYGSPDLVDELLRHELIDEYRLHLYPVILGSGKRLFRDRIETHHLRLVGTRTFSSGVVLLTYAPDAVIPTSRFVEEYQWTHEQIRSLQAAEDIDRTLATVLFADIVDSTGRAAAMGDRAWRKLLENHHRVVQGEVQRWHGQNVEFAGDGVMAMFDAPTRALRCAFELVGAARDLGVEIRAGIHTGEIERRETGIGGIAVHIAARLLSAAERGQVVVTKTVRDLATGTDLTFSPLGVTSLRGVPGEWDLFEARTSDRS